MNGALADSFKCVTEGLPPAAWRMPGGSEAEAGECALIGALSSHASTLEPGKCALTA